MNLLNKIFTITTIISLNACTSFKNNNITHPFFRKNNNRIIEKNLITNEYNKFEKKIINDLQSSRSYTLPILDFPEHHKITIDFPKHTYNVEDIINLGSVIIKIKKLTKNSKEVFIIGHSHDEAEQYPAKLAINRTKSIASLFKMIDFHTYKLHYLSSWGKLTTTDYPSHGVQIYFLNNY